MKQWIKKIGLSLIITGLFFEVAEFLARVFPASQEGATAVEQRAFIKSLGVEALNGIFESDPTRFCKVRPGLEAIVHGTAGGNSLVARALVLQTIASLEGH